MEIFKDSVIGLADHLKTGYSISPTMQLKMFLRNIGENEIIYVLLPWIYN